MNSPYSIKELCCGCTACSVVCPTKAIAMHSDEDGFEYPVINPERCIDCKKCIDICDFTKREKVEGRISKIYAMKAEDNTRKHSSSGGAFTVLSDYILNDRGKIFGCTFDENFIPKMVLAETHEERNAMCGSKYVDSEINDMICSVKQQLEDGLKVFFTGTPCQCAAIKKCIPGRVQENLLLCDIYCHGVPSRKLWRDYINYFEAKHRKKIKFYGVRSKEKGWKAIDKVTFIDGSTVCSMDWVKTYCIWDSLRPSCYNCKYRGYPRDTDISIGDFFSIGDYAPSFYDDLGVSIVSANSEKGQRIVDIILDKTRFIEISESDRKKIISTAHDVKYTKAAMHFYEDYHDNGIEYVIKKSARKFDRWLLIDRLKRLVSNPRALANKVALRLLHTK